MIRPLYHRLSADLPASQHCLALGVASDTFCSFQAVLRGGTGTVLFLFLIDFFWFIHSFLTYSLTDIVTPWDSIYDID